MIMLLTGDNTFAIRDAVQAQLQKAKEKLGADAITIVDGNELNLPDLPQLLQGASLFASERLVVIRDASVDKAIWDKLADILPDASDAITILLVASTADKRTRTYKWLQKNAEVREAKALSDNDLVSWLQATAKKGGGELGLDAARYLVDYVGPDQWRLKHDLEKLILIGKPIDKELIRELIEPNPQSSAFELLDAVFAGRTDEASKLLDLIKGSEDPYRFFGLLANQIYALLLCAYAGTRDQAAIARDAGVHPFVIKKMQAVARRLDARQKQQAIETMATLDRQMKSTGHDPWTLIHVSLTKITA